MKACFVIPLVIGVALPSMFAQGPRIVSTSPSFWATRVDSREKEVSISFDQRVVPAFTDWLGRSGSPPNLDLNSINMSADQKTFHIRMRPEAAKVYVMALNEKAIPGVGFQNERGISMPRTYLVFQTAGTAVPGDAPPRALRTSPGNGAQDVNPAATKAVLITFDRPMNAKKHGLHLLEDKKTVELKTASFSYSPDGKTFTLNYSFKPSTHYDVQMNSTEDIGFSTTNRIPLWPVHFAFTTGQPR